MASERTRHETRRAKRRAMVCAILALATPPLARAAPPPTTTAATLLDRVQIEDLLVDYYGSFGAAHETFGSFYAPDGVLDINGRVYHGAAGVVQAYKDAAMAAKANPTFRGRFHMLMTNPHIVVTGATATADLIWTGVASNAPTDTPHFVEQGREHDELVKRGGRWLIARRVITSDAGLTPFYAKTYQNR